MFTQKTKKLSIVTCAITSAVVLSTFGGFAVGPTEKPLDEETIGTSSEVGAPSEQKAGTSSVNEKTEPKIIRLDTPGDYRFVGAEKALSEESLGPNEIIVNINDIIYIGDMEVREGGMGDPHETYNIILDNANIYTKNDGRCDIRPINIGKNADVNLTLVGKNSLVYGSENSGGGIGGGSEKTKLTINGLGEDASLDTEGGFEGIDTYNLTINGGTITATGRQVLGICVFNNLIINGGTIIATGGSNGAHSNNHIEINGGTITATGGGCGICSENDMKINGGIITAIGECDSGICSDNNIEINGGKVDSNNINSEKNLIVNGGELIVGSIVGRANDEKINVDHHMIRLFNESAKLNATYDESTNTYGIYDDKGEWVCIKNAGKNHNDNILVYHISLDLGYPNSVNFYMTGGTINGIIDCSPDTYSNTSTNEMQFGSQFSNQFPTSGSGKEFCDTTIFFNGK